MMLVVVARFDHTFVMPATPARSQSLFQEEVGPNLRREGEYKLVGNEPGRLVYSTGTGDGLKAGLIGVTLDRLAGRRIQVEFTAEETGTSVRVRGDAPRPIRAWVVLLGTPGRWPAGADVG